MQVALCARAQWSKWVTSQEFHVWPHARMRNKQRMHAPAIEIVRSLWRQLTSCDSSSRACALLSLSLSHGRVSLLHISVRACTCACVLGLRCLVQYVRTFLIHTHTNSQTHFSTHTQTKKHTQIHTRTLYHAINLFSHKHFLQTCTHTYSLMVYMHTLYI